MITTCGPLLPPLGHNLQRQLGDDWQIHTRSWAAPAAHARYNQPTRIGVNVEHGDHEIGEVVGLRHHAGALWAVCEANLDELLDFPEPIYYSAEVTMNKDSTDVLVEGVALCDRPAAVCLAPVTLYKGSVAEAIFRTNFPRDDFHSKEILEQALEQRYTRHGGPITISHPPPVVDRRHGEHGTPAMRREVFVRPSRILSIR